MKNLIFCLVVVIPFCLIACDPQSDYKMIVQNKSSYEIFVNLQHEIEPSKEKAIYEYHGLGGPGSNNKCEPPLGDEKFLIEIPYRTDLKVTKDLSDMNNWSYSKKGSRWKGYKIRCLSTITDADIVPK